MRHDTIVYSLVVTCYYEEKSVDEFYSRARVVLEQTGVPYEIIFVNDGSTDGTYERLCDIYEKDERVSHVIDLTRNFGQGAALTAGMSVARGEYVVYLDSDLQLDPEDLPKLIEKQHQGYELVRGYRSKRIDPLHRKVCSWFVNRLAARSLEVKDVGATYFILVARILHQFEFGQWHSFAKRRLFPYFNRIGQVPVSHHARRYGKSGQPFLRLWKGAIGYLINASDMVFQYIAIAAGTVAVLILLRVAYAFAFGGKILASVSNGLLLNAVAATFFVLLGVLCLIGEFCVRSFMQGQKKPCYIIREVRSRTRSDCGGATYGDVSHEAQDERGGGE